jgi:hypothetical protein
MKSVTQSHPASNDDAVTIPDLIAEAAEIQGTVQLRNRRGPPNHTPWN